MGVVEVKDTSGQFGQILDRVEKGEEILLTRSGRPVARLLPDGRTHDPEQVGAALRELHDIRSRLTSGGLGLKDAINEGRP